MNEDRVKRIEEAMFSLMVASAERGRVLSDQESDMRERMTAMMIESLAFEKLHKLVIQ